ncbi:MAG TPA: hypothetical protein VKY51_07160 [Fredinandcohnia sp.]|nr:hypothetical protein [Fredinandcohnia sp.]
MEVRTDESPPREERERRPAHVPGRRLRSLLEPFGVDARSVFPLGENTCVERDCRRRALLGELVCPVHYGLATPEEMPDYLSDAAARGRRVVRSVVTAIALAVLGAVIGAWVGDARFGWLGGAGAGLVLTAGISRELKFHRLASALGLFGFLVATILAVAGTLVATIAALPWILQKLLPL